MKTRIISLLLSILLIVNICPIMTNAEPFDPITKQLMVAGNRLAYADDENANIRLVGVNIPSLGWGKPGDKEEHIYESLSEGCEGWNSNLIRLPVLPNRWFDEATAPTYKKWIDDMIEGCRARGKYLIIDCHTYVMPTEVTLAFWLDICKLYANDPVVMFGLCNEPHDIVGTEESTGKTQWQIWRNGGTILTDGKVVLSVGHQALVEAIRDTGAKNILVAGGLNWGYDLKGIVGKAGSVGSADYGVSYALIDQGSNGDTSKEGYGIMYDSHIYPSKGQVASYDAAVGCVRDFAPVLIGEFGWDSSDSAVTGNNQQSVYNIWMPELMDWIDNVDGKYDNPANFTAWNFHPTSSPRVITGWAFDPSYFLGVYLKERMLNYPSNNIPVTGTYTNNFSPDVFRLYETVKSGTGSVLTTAVGSGALKITYTRPADAGNFASRMLLPVDWVLNGVQTLEFNLKGDALAVGTGLKIGFEGTDTEVWTREYTVEDTNNNRIVIPINQLQKQGNPKADGILNAAIRSIYVGITTPSKGVLTISDVQITKSANPTIPFPAAVPYVEAKPDYNIDMETDATKITVTKNDKGPGGSLGDYFTTTVENGIGVDGSAGVKVDYQRTQALWGGFSQASFSAGTNFSDAKYVSICIKGDGQAQLAQIKLEKGGMNINIPADTEWRQYTFRLRDIGVFVPGNIVNVQFHAGTKMAGTYYVDNLVISAYKPQNYLPFVPYSVGNGFEDSLVNWSSIDGGAGDSITGKIVTGGYNTQNAYRLTYTRGEGNAAIAQGLFPTWDMKDASKLTLDVKADVGQTEKMNIMLLDKVNVPAILSEPITITDEWQRLEFDIEDFMIGYDNILPSRIKGIQLSVPGINRSGNIYIDNITFSNAEVEPPVPFEAQYMNNFDPDVYAQNGGTWTNVGDDGTAYIRAQVSEGAGYIGSGLVFTMNGSNANRRVDMTGGFPSEWDFTKVKYASLMVKGLNQAASDGKMQYLNKFNIDLYYDYVDNGGAAKSIKTGTINLDAASGSWSHVMVPILPNSSATPAQVAATNRMSIYSTLSQNGGFIIDDFMLCDMKPKPVMPIEPVEYLEAFDSNTVFHLTGGYYNSESDYLFRKDKGFKHWGRSMQYIMPEGAVPNNSSQTTYFYANLPVSWTLERATHFVFMGKLFLPADWVREDYSIPYGTLDQPATRLKMRIALVDIDGVEYSQELLATNSDAWVDYKLPLTDFVNSRGEQPAWRDIVQLRMYPTEAGQSGIKMDNMGFKTIDVDYNMTVTGITAIVGSHDLKTSGMIGGEATITANLEGQGKQVTLIAALYNKAEGSLERVASEVKNVMNEPDPTSVHLKIQIPEQAQDYTLRVYVWDSLSKTIKPFAGENAWLTIN